MKRCLLNVAFGPGWWPRGQDRLCASLQKYTPSVEFLRWTNSVPPGCPGHKQVPYAFKPYAFWAALQKGYRTALWVDAAAVCRRDLIPAFEHIERHGHYLQDNAGQSTGRWCTDAALKPLGITREESFKYPHLMACIMGLDLQHPRSVEFLNEWKRLADDKITFPGPWQNKNGEASSDPRVAGHRHDQTAASIVSIRLGMEWTPLKDGFLKYGPPDMAIPDHVYFTTQGM